MDGFMLWLISSTTLWLTAESLNCNFPYHDGEIDNAGIVCQWEHESFYYDEKEDKWILFPEDPNDNWIEEKSRKRYWEKRNVDE